MIKRIAILFAVLLPVACSRAQNNSETEIDQMILDYKYPVKHIEIDDTTKVAYLDEGTGSETLLFIHGLATYLPAWYTNIDVLKTNYRCIAIDLPGYGRSSKGNYPSTMTYYAGIVSQLIDNLQLEKVILVGHSMGGQIASTIALNHSDKVDKLILLAPAGFETFNGQQKMWLKSVFTATTLLNATEEQIRSNWELNFHQMPDEVEFMIEDRIVMKSAKDFKLYCQSVVRGVHGMLNEPIFDQLQNISQETLVVYGENDRLIPNKYLNPHLTTKNVAENGAEKIPNVTLKYISECGHFISFDKPDEINEIITDFLTK